jgi:hypothetical protein
LVSSTCPVLVGLADREPSDPGVTDDDADDAADGEVEPLVDPLADPLAAVSGSRPGSVTARSMITAAAPALAGKTASA